MLTNIDYLLRRIENHEPAETHNEEGIGRVNNAF